MLRIWEQIEKYLGWIVVLWFGLLGGYIAWRLGELFRLLKEMSDACLR